MQVGFAHERGCGHGLPGCLLFRMGIQSGCHTKVLFADFNDFVVKGVTSHDAQHYLGHKGLSIGTLQT